MHPNPVFRQASRDQDLAFARARGFGALCVNAPGGPLVSHVPFLLSGDATEAELHLVRSNPILRLLDAPREAVIVVSGPDAYVSPDWYGIADQVPTWNYVAVHLRGALEAAAADELFAMLERLSAAFEARLAPKAPWTTAKMSAGLMDRMMRGIAPCRLKLNDVSGTWKLNQNKPEPVRLDAAARIAASTTGHELAALAALMRAGGPPDPEQGKAD